MKGSLRFESAEGFGTTFRIGIPLHMPHSMCRSTAVKLERDKEGFLREHKLLVAVQDNMLRRLIQRMSEQLQRELLAHVPASTWKSAIRCTDNQ